MTAHKDMLKFYLIFFYVIFATYLVWLTNYKSFMGIDDANIYMVYITQRPEILLLAINMFLITYTLWKLVWFSEKFVPNDKVKSTNIVLSSQETSMLQHINKESRFKEKYSRVVIQNKNFDFSLIIFASNSFLNTLDKNTYSYNHIGFE